MIRKKKEHKHFTPSLVMILAVLLFHASSYHTYSQISYGGKPVHKGPGRINEIPVITMPEFDAAGYLPTTQAGPDSRLKPLVFAKSFAINIEPGKDGLWENLPGEGSVWRIALESKGAYSLNIIFSKFALNPGASLFVYNEDKSHILGAYDHRNNQPSGSLAVEPVGGDKLIVEIQVAEGTGNYGELVIGSLNHDFIGIPGIRNNKQTGPSGKCNIDINCPPGNQWHTGKNSVTRIVINGNTLCTGVLVNNTANDGKPYVLTANHCINDSIKAARSVFLFGYESPFCNGGPGSVNNTRSGSDLLVTQANLDFTLVEIREMPPQSWYPYYSGWDRSGAIPKKTVSIHHPNGDVKKIAVDNDPPSTDTFGPGYTPNGHWHINRWEIGTTEPGSSGSPLFDQDGYLKGLLTGGDAKCGNAVDDFFCKFSLAWDNYEGINRQLKPWLDPLGTGAVNLNGINPFAENELSAGFRVSSIEVCEGDQVVFTDFSTGNIDSWLWEFGSGATPSGATTRGPHMVTYSESGTRTVSLTVTGNDSSDTEDMEYSLVVKTEELPVSEFSFAHDDLSVQFNDMSQYAENYYWEFGDRNTSTQMNPVNKYSTTGEYTVSQLVRNRACSDTSVQVIILSPNWADPGLPAEKLRIYPVPADSYIIIESEIPFSGEIQVEILSITGQSLIKKRPAPGKSGIFIELNRVPSGTYLLKILSGKEYITTKIQVIR